MHHNWRGDDFPRGPWQTEYVRADLATPLNDPRVAALVEALSLIAVVGYSDDPKVNASIAKQTVDQARATLEAIASPSIATQLNDPRVKALVEALREYACDCGYACEQLNGTCGDTARAALSALEENK
jgi:hypothetical protein